MNGKWLHMRLVMDLVNTSLKGEDQHSNPIECRRYSRL